MDLRPINAPEVVEFLSQQPATAGSFLQSTAWGRFEEALGTRVEQVGFWEGGRLVGTALITLRLLPGGLQYAYVARGPLVEEQHFVAALEALVNYGKTKKVLFLRAEPPLANSFSTTSRNQWPGTPGFVKAPDVQPRATVVLDLRLSTNELLQQMREKTRYNIRLSERKDLTWHLRGPESLEGFWNLLCTTTKRDGFAAHPKNHYQKLLELYGTTSLTPETDIAVRVAEVFSGTELLAANLIIFSHGVVTYLHGASGNNHRELMPTYLLHWRTLQEAKALGFTWYDWWGVAPADGSKSSWQGISRFKLGFGGKRLEYHGAFDYAYQPAFYKLYCLVRQARHWF